jgi:1-acyl-sn-glycerol-3-phosphate acyltransferase
MSKPFHEPPIQRGHPIYRMMLPWVGSAVSRYHRITGTEGIEKIPEPGVPVILVCNHQNGLMDPLIHCGLMRQHQVHWLTRSDIFYHPVARFLMFSFNQMPIFRQRDRLPDIDARNRRIFEICVERLRCGAVIGLFPEGNHHGSKSIRPMKRGFVDLLDLGLKTDPTLARLQLIPVGLDYEQYDGFRRRLRYRVGDPIPYLDAVDPEKNSLQPSILASRVATALRNLCPDIQPERGYGALAPYVRALRTTERCGPEWEATAAHLATLGTADEAALEHVARAWDAVHRAGAEHWGRPEDWGRTPAEARRAALWIPLLAPLAAAAGAPTAWILPLLHRQGLRRIKDVCFRSTFHMTLAMALFPLVWAVEAIGIAWAWDSGLPAFAEWGVAAMGLAAGSRFAGWWWGHALDFRGAWQARRFWKQKEVADLWRAYITAVTSMPHLSNAPRP